MHKDKFKSRLMIPIFNKQGQVIGFTGRVFPWDKSERPKYLNSSQSQWFNKGENWYGWHLAKESIKQTKQVILVEGNMDVIAGHCHKVENILASQGTSVGLSQVKQLRNLQVQDVLLAFDNDNAGRISATKLYLLCQQVGLNTYQIIINSQYKDLDEYLQTNSHEPNYNKFTTQEYGQYLIDSHKTNLQSTDLITQKLSIEQILKTLSQLENRIYQEQLIKYLSQLSGINQDNLEVELSKLPKVRNFEEINSGHAPMAIAAEKQVTPFQAMINIAWDKVMALHLDKSLDPKYETITETIFYLFGTLWPAMREAQSLDNYILVKQVELELIKTELKAGGVWINLLTDQSQANLIKTIINYIISTKANYSSSDQEIINQDLTHYLKS